MVAEGMGTYTLPSSVCNHYLCYLSHGEINRLLLLLLFPKKVFSTTYTNKVSICETTRTDRLAFSQYIVTLWTVCLKL